MLSSRTQLETVNWYKTEAQPTACKSHLFSVDSLVSCISLWVSIPCYRASFPLSLPRTISRHSDRQLAAKAHYLAIFCIKLPCAHLPGLRPSSNVSQQLWVICSHHLTPWTPLLHQERQVKPEAKWSWTPALSKACAAQQQMVECNF